MESGRNLMNVNKEEALREVFEETVPDHGVIRFLIYVFLYFLLTDFLFTYESPIYMWIISFITLAAFNILVWRIIRNYQFTKFKSGST